MLTKVVNGVAVEFSSQEEAAIRAEWDANDPAKRPAIKPLPTIADVLAVLSPEQLSALDARLATDTTA